MKKYAVLLTLVILTILAATGCSKKQEVAWQTISYTMEDGTEATIKVSPWINTENQDYLNAAWDEVSNGNVLPQASAEGWNLKYKRTTSGKSFWRPERCLDGYENEAINACELIDLTDITKIYYCIGEISTSTDATDIPLWISACQSKDNNSSNEDEYTMSYTLTRLSESQKVEPTWAKINSNRNTFVIAYFVDEESVSEITNTYFYVTDTNYYLWEKGWNQNSASKLTVIE